MTIEVNYDPANEACPTLGHFEMNWIHNSTLHPELKKIPYALIESDEDGIYVLDDESEILKYIDPLRLDELSNYLLDEII